MGTVNFSNIPVLSSLLTLLQTQLGLFGTDVSAPVSNAVAVAVAVAGLRAVGALGSAAMPRPAGVGGATAVGPDATLQAPPTTVMPIVATSVVENLTMTTLRRGLCQVTC